MLHFDFVNPYVVYAFFNLAAAFCIYLIFTRKAFIQKHKDKIIFIVMLLLIWTQYVRYIDVILSRSEWSWGSHLPFYMCRVSVVVLLYYTITKDKKVETFLFYWGALGLAGILYPNGPISNIPNLTETFYIDHFVLTLTPFFLVAYQGYKPTMKGLYTIVGVMFVMLCAFIPLNQLWETDYFYLANQSIFGVLFPGQPTILFIVVHCIAAGLFFYGYYSLFKNYGLEVKESNENRIVY